jgi:hypothetical protein
MRSLLIVFFFACVSLLQISWAAPLMSQADRQGIQQIHNELLRSKGEVSKQLQNAYPIYNINGRWYLSMLGRCNAQFKAEELEWQRILFQKPIAGLLSLKVPLQKLAALKQLKGIDYLEIAGRISPNQRSPRRLRTRRHRTTTGLRGQRRLYWRHRLGF